MSNLVKFTTFIILAFVVYCNVEPNGKGIFIACAFQFIIVLLYVHKNYDRSITLLLFLLSFFTFFIGQDLIVMTLANQLQRNGIFIIRIYELQIPRYNAIYLSLLFIFIGYASMSKRFKTYDSISINAVTQNVLMIRVRKALLTIFYLTLIFTIVKIVSLAPAILTGSYAKSESEVSQSTNLLSFLNTFVYLAYLCCFPSKTELLKSLPWFILVTVGSVAMGTRGEMVCTLLLLTAFFLSQDLYLDYTQKYITKRVKFIILALSPIILIGLSLFASIRSGEEVESRGMGMDFLGFFLQQGGTGSLIVTAEELKNSLPETNTSYTFGPVLKLLRSYTYTPQEVAINKLQYEATYGNNIGATLTYLSLPSYYYAGGGLGTSYLAELYVDYGYSGIIIYSFLLGIVLRYVSFDVRKTLMGRLTSSLLLVGFFFLPRDFALNASRLLTPAYIFSFIGVMVICAYYKHKLKTI